MISYRALELGASAVDLGVVSASYAVLSLLLAAPMGRWVDRLGEVRFLIGGAGVISLTVVGLAFANTIPALAVAQALLGLGQVTSLVGLQTFVANGGGKSGRDSRFGAFTVIGSLSQMVGPMASGFLYGTLGMPLSYVFFVAVIPLGIAILGSLSLWMRPPSRHLEQAKAAAPAQEPFFRSVADVMRQPSIPHAMIASMTVLSTIDLLVAYLPAYGEANGIAANTIGLLLGVRAAASMASRLMMTRLVARSNRQRVLVQSLVLSTAAILVLPLTSHTVALFILLAVAGYGLGLGQPLSMSWVADKVPRAVRGTALGVRITGNRVGQLVVPLTVGAIAGAAGIGAIFYASGAMLGFSSWWTSRAPD